MVDAKRSRTRKGFGSNRLLVLWQLDRTRKSSGDKALVLWQPYSTRRLSVDKALVLWQFDRTRISRVDKALAGCNRSKDLAAACRPPVVLELTPIDLTNALISEATTLGFAMAGACPAVEPGGYSRLLEWLDRGFGGEMDYLRRRQEAYRHPSGVLLGVRSLLLLALPYRSVEPANCGTGFGRVSRYAWSSDYHDVVHAKLKQLAEFLREHVHGATARGVVDTAPLLEREFAELAGIGWIGKNTLVLNRQLGSWFFLAALLTDAELVYNETRPADHCGTCTACLDACPTQAFVEPYVLDARRCISYLTIELRGSVPRELRPGIGDWLFGCDVCQDVCPWNHATRSVTTSEFIPREGLNPVDLVACLELGEREFRHIYRDTPLWRARRRGVLRTAAIILGNQRHLAAEPQLIRLLDDDDAIVRSAAAWALGQIGLPTGAGALARRLEAEADEGVREELTDALRHAQSGVEVESNSG